MPVIRIRRLPTPAIRTSIVSPSATRETLPCQNVQRGAPGSELHGPRVTAMAAGADPNRASTEASRARQSLRGGIPYSVGGDRGLLDDSGAPECVRPYLQRKSPVTVIPE